MRIRLALSHLALLLGLSACGEELPAETDGGVDAGADAVAPELGPAAPEVPALPNFAPCPEGWRAEPSGDGFDICEPFPEGGRPACPRDEAFFPGASTCALIGTPCPTGDFPTDLPAGAPVVYVLAGAVGGDGTEAAPFGTLNDAIAVVEAGATIALGKGRYSEALTIPGGVSLVGACVAETVLTFDGGSYSAGVVNVGGAEVVIRNLRIADAARTGILVAGEGRSAMVEDVVVHDCALVGIGVEMGAMLHAERVLIRDIRSVESLSALGRGLNVEMGAEAVVRWLHVEGAKEFAAGAIFGGDLTLEDATLVDTRLASPTAPAGAGVMVGEGGQLLARRVVVDEGTMIGVIVQNAGTRALVEDLVVRRTRPGNTFGGARGIDANQLSSLSCTRCLVEDVLESGIGAIFEASVALTDSVVRRVGPRVEDERFGRGLLVQEGGALHVERVAVIDLREHGAAAHGEGTRLTGSDLVIRRVTSEAYAGEFGRGLSIDAGAFGELSRVEIGHVVEAGVLLKDGGAANLTDLFVHEVRGRPSQGGFGRGISVQVDSRLTMTRARIEEVFELGIASLGEGAEVSAVDVSVLGVVPQNCSEGTCAYNPAGHGVGSYFGAQVALRRFAVSDTSLCGVQVVDDATLSLAAGVVRGALIGACLQSDAQDIADLQEDVRYVDNGSNLEATNLPVPMPLGSARAGRE